MKNSTLLIIVLICIPFFTKAQDVNLLQPTIPESDVPQEILANQDTLFPGGFISEWQLQKGFDATDDKAVRYISKFEQEGNPGSSASYLPDGTLIFHSEYMEARNIPETVRLKLQFDHKDFGVDYADFITVYVPEREIYRIHLRKDTRVKHAFYDINGNQIPEKSLPIEIILYDR
ncbi:hypothetical protein [Marixanthomonas ophiurae]|uniref:Uncharacterized protein n=1 Tax=Marixanthomonas ophiurae TaxID=387659 RepID=A0A3E1Q750_9FLAO|nr:hypothetical protein [Marixanthomonas ophiurae]RFN57944.1 hypothetical protein DZ858_11925 [Marixanthomonas ophiurae]